MPRDRDRKLSIALALVLAALFAARAAAADPTLVKIDSGAVRGVEAGGVIGFKGIPFAAPPIGPLRWRAPQPVKPWQDVLDASEFGPSCMQPDDVPKSEDCLTLNVWRPADSTGPLPVMVWIYGGALVHGGTPLYPADALAKQGVVVVSMNYRMGRLGFFAHPALAEEAPDEVRGNYGFMDQRAALEWVQRNIAAFGGDQTQVTIFGESAGGGSVMVHLTSPLSRSLFHRAILQSPGIPTARAGVIGLTELADAEKLAVDYARSRGITGDGATALAALRALPPEKLVEGASAPEEIEALSAGTPLIGVAGAIRDGKLIVEAPEAALAAGRQHLADETARAGQLTWLYRFSYVAGSKRGSVQGALHGLEIPYTFDIPAAIVGADVTAADKAMGDLASAYWVAFAKSGDPNGAGRTEWPRHDPSVDRVIDFTNDGVVVGPDPLKARLDLWRKVHEAER